MTDEEHQKLCSYLRKTSGWEERLAADEIMRLETDIKYWKDRCGRAEGAMLRMRSISSEYTRQIIESECGYGKPND